jgi:hypothetical protein
LLSADTLFMGKEQLSIRLEPETLRHIDELAAKENRARNNMIEVLISESLAARLAGRSDILFEQLDALRDKNLTGEALKEEIRRSRSLTGAKRGSTPKAVRGAEKPKKPGK